MAEKYPSVSRGASNEAYSVRDNMWYVEAPVLLSQESHPHLGGWNRRRSMRSWSWSYTATFCLVGSVFCKISWSCGDFTRFWYVSESLNQQWCGLTLMPLLQRGEREAVGNGTYCRSVCFHLNAVVFVFRSKEEGRAPGSVVSLPISVTVCLFAEKWLTAHVRHKHPFITQLVSP